MHERLLAIRAATAAIVFLVSWSAAAQGRDPTPISLSRALELARTNNPALRAARHRIEEANGDLVGAGVLLVNNPELSARAGRRVATTPGAEASMDLEVELEQRIELGGQRGHRLDHATARQEASRADAQDVRRVVELAVTFAFFDAVAAERRVQIRQEGQQLATRLFEVATRRLERGSGTPLEVNTARIRQAEAQRRLVAAAAKTRSTLLRLQQLIVLPAGEGIEVHGTLPADELTHEPDELVARAFTGRPDLHIRELQVEAAQAVLELADAQAWPDLSVGVSYGKEEGNTIVLGGIRLPIPIFNRNQGQRHRARAAVERVRAERDARRLAVESEVLRAHTDYLRARDTLRLYDAEVLQAQKESLVLLQRAFEAGEVGYADVIVVQREVLEGREGLLDVRLELSLARAALLASAGISQIPTQQGDKP